MKQCFTQSDVLCIKMPAAAKMGFNILAYALLQKCTECSSVDNL